MRFFLCAGTPRCDCTRLGDYGSWRAARVDLEALAADLEAAFGPRQDGGAPGVLFFGERDARLALWIAPRFVPFSEHLLRHSMTRLRAAGWMIGGRPLSPEALHRSTADLVTGLGAFVDMMERLARATGWQPAGQADTATEPRETAATELMSRLADAASSPRSRSLIGRALAHRRRFMEMLYREATRSASASISAAVALTAHAERRAGSPVAYAYGRSRATIARG